ncbi:hypothetical protein NQZ68_025937 [Dissostichus eleginoides]|nr:hypothetical protein NQZ68_025937 [Dissostichus eleginoides]
MAVMAAVKIPPCCPGDISPYLCTSLIVTENAFLKNRLQHKHHNTHKIPQYWSFEPDSFTHDCAMDAQETAAATIGAHGGRQRQLPTHLQGYKSRAATVINRQNIVRTDLAHWLDSQADNRILQQQPFHPAGTSHQASG